VLDDGVGVSSLYDWAWLYGKLLILVQQQSPYVFVCLTYIVGIGLSLFVLLLGISTRKVSSVIIMIYQCNFVNALLVIIGFTLARKIYENLVPAEQTESAPSNITS
jgi:hypothetical protein